MKYSEEEALKAARVLNPQYNKLEITVETNILGDTDEEKYTYRVYAIKKNGKKVWVGSYKHSHITKALQSLMKTYGYCCGEDIDNQERSILAAYPNAIIIKDASKWDNICKNLNKGDTLVYDRVSVMNSDHTEAIKLYEYCYDREINLVFLKEPHLNTDTYRKAMESTLSDNGSKSDIVSKALMNLIGEQIRIAIENPIEEAVSISQRTKDGIERARLNGKQIGQPKGAKLTTKKSLKMKEIILNSSKDFNGTLTDPEMLELTKLARGTYYKYKRELRLQL
jgi:hypothetical protein